MAIVVTRVVGGAVVFWLLAARGGRVVIERRDWGRLLGCAALGVVVNQTCFVQGLARSTATNATVLIAMIPVLTAGFAALSGSERLRARRLAGILVALGGALVLVRVDRFSWQDDHAVGNLLILINSCAYATFLLLVRPLAERYRPMVIVALLFAVATPPIVGLGAGEWIEVAPRLTPGQIALLLFIVAVPTVGAYALNQLAIRRADATTVATYIYLQPVFAAIGAAVLLDERPTLRTLASAALIFAGVYLGAGPNAGPNTGPKARSRGSA